MKKERLNLGVSAEEPFAVGFEKEIFPHNDPGKIVKLTRDDLEGKFLPGNERYIKAEYYLTKILHLLFPRNIPDIHLASFAYEGSVHEKKELDPDHNTFREFVLKREISPKEITEDDKQNAIKAYERLESRKLDDSFIEICRSLGLIIDDSPRNYGRDADGNTVYIDSILPWNPAHRYAPDLPFRTNFNPEQLHTLIASLSESDRALAEHYLQRLVTLADEERASHDALEKKLDFDKFEK